MAKIEKKTISVKDPFGDIKQSAKDAETEVLLLSETLKILIEQAKKLKKDLPSTEPKNLPSLKKQNLLIKDSALLTKQWVASQNALTKAQAKADVTSKSYRDAQSKLRLEQQKLNKESKEEAELTSKIIGAYRKKSIELNRLKKEIKDLTLTEGQESKQVKKLLVDYEKLNSQIRRADKSVGEFSRNVGNYPNNVNKATASLKNLAGALGVTVGIATLGRVVKNTIKIYADFEQGNANLAAVLGTTKDQITALTNDAKRLGAVTSFSATQVSTLQTEFAKLGFNEQEILNATEATLDLAAATGSELGEAAAIAGATLGGFGLDAKETQRVTDLMAKSFSTSALDLEKFKESMKDAAPAAKAVGVDIEKTTALLGTLANAGISGSKAGTALKTGFIELNAAGINLDDGLEKIANSQDKLATATDLVGKRAATSFLVLAGGVKTTKELEKGLNNAGGAAKKMADEQLDTLTGKTKILNSAWEGLVLGLFSGDSAFSSVSKSIVEGTTALLGMLTPAEELADAWFSQRDAVDSLESSVTPLLDRYDELKEKTELTKEEQEELDSIILKVAQDVPLAITEFDKYGKALDISTSSARNFIQQQKDLLALDNAEAIEEQQDAIIDLDRDLRQLNNTYKVQDGVLKRVRQNYKSGTSVLVDATSEEIRSYQKSNEEIQKNIDLRNAKIALLRGEKTELEKLADAESDLIKVEEESNGGKGAGGKSKAQKKAEQDQKDLQKFNDQAKKERDRLAQQQADDKTKQDRENDKNREDLQNKRNKQLEIDAEKERKLRLKEEKETLKAIEEANKKAEEERLEKRQEALEKTSAAVEGFTDKFLSDADKRIAKIDEEINKSEEQSNRLQALADSGDIKAKQSLAEQQNIQAEAEAEKAKLEQQKQNINLISGVILAYNSALQNGATPQEALKESFLGTASIQGFISALSVPTFFDGTDNTGSHGQGIDGKGGFNAILHPNERVLTSKHNDLIGDIQNDELAKVMFDYRTGNMSMGSNIVVSQNDNSEVIKGLGVVTEAIKNIPQNNIELGEITQGYMILNQTKSKGNRKTTNRFKVN